MLTKNSSLKTTFTGIDFSKYNSKVSDFVKEFSSRANQPGKFLNWVNLPQEQIKRLDDIYSLAEKLKAQTGVDKLSVLGIGGSKHTVEHMLGINGLNICGNKILFYSDVDSISLERFLAKLNNDVLSSNYMIASKSGSTFETKDGFLRIQKIFLLHLFLYFFLLLLKVLQMQHLLQLQRFLLLYLLQSQPSLLPYQS